MSPNLDIGSDIYDLIPDEFLERWQNSVNLLAKVADVPAALIMKFQEPYLEVFVSSQTDKNNPYHVGDKEKKYGLYCETVVENQQTLDIPNALKDPEWDDNPDLELGMLNYLGIPINWPDGKPFGTICILDRKERHYSESQRELLNEYGKIVEDYLVLLYDKLTIQHQSQIIKNLSKIVPMCAYCRRIRDPENHWVDVEEYVYNNYHQSTSHGICEDCMQKELENNPEL